MARIFVKPVAGRTVPTPDGAPLAAEGETVERSRWWSRRQRDGDVEITAEKPASKAPSKGASKAAKED